MPLSPYISFAGNCAEATAFYQQAVGAELLYKITFGEMPKDENSEEGCPSGMNFPDTAIAHSNVRIAGSDIMMSDGIPPAAARNTRVSHWCSTPVMCRKASAGSTTSPMAAILKWPAGDLLGARIWHCDRQIRRAVDD